MRKHISPASESTTTDPHATPRRASPRSWHQEQRVFAVRRGALWSALLSSAALLANSPAAAQFVCTVTATDSTCTNTGNATANEINEAAGTNQNATTTNSGTAVGFESQTDAGGNATATNSGSNTGSITVITLNGGNATATNTETNTGVVEAVTEGGGIWVTPPPPAFFLQTPLTAATRRQPTPGPSPVLSKR